MNEADKKILYVDDERSNLKTFEIAFEDDFQIYTCESAREALELLGKEGEMPVIITDQRMPGMTGIEFLERTIPIYPDSIKILLTAYTEKDYLLDAINTGKVYNYIVKPWEETEVRKILKEAFERYHLVKENKRLVHELQEKIAQLKAAQEKLIFQEKVAVVGKLAAGLSHEIKNLLNPINLLDFIRDRLNEEELTYLKYIYESRDRIVNLIDEVRALARNEDTNYTILPGNIRSTVEEAVFLARMDSDVRDRTITTFFDYDGEAMFNRGKIVQVILNLIRNSAHAIAGNKDGEITIRTGRDGAMALISVEDNGTGIPEKELDLIWHPFFTTKGEKGTGIGLDISRRIVEGHEGTIRCESKPGIRTIFVFTLKAVDASGH